MKKYILLLTTIALSTFAMAQSKPSFGIRAGVTSAGMKGDAVASVNNIVDYANGMITTGSKTGFFAGGYAAIPLGEHFSLEPGVAYSQKGYEMRGDLNLKGTGFLGANAKARLNTQYIDVPLLVKANMGGFQVFAGPQVSYLVNADVRTTAGVLGINLLNKTMDATNNFNRWDAGITGGIGYGFSNGMNITAAYDHGLSRVDANKSMNAYNRAFKVGLGVTF